MNARHRTRRSAAIVTIGALAAVTLGAWVPAQAAENDTVSLSGAVWDDVNGNGRQDEGEPGMADLPLAVLDPDMTPILDPDQNPLLAVTDASGAYTFGALPALATTDQHYTVYLFAPDGYVSTTGLTKLESGYTRLSTADLTAANAAETGVDFAIAKPTTVSVGGVVWDDGNRNGRKDAGEAGLPDVQLAVLDPDGSPIMDPDQNPLLVATDANGAYSFAQLPPLATTDQHYTAYLFAPDGYASTTGLDPLEGGYLRPTSADLTAPGTSDTSVDFALAAGAVDPGSGGDPGTGDDWLVMPNWHADVLYPEIDTAGDGSQTLALRAHIDTYQPEDWNDLVVYHTDVTKETLPDNYTPAADYSFIGAPGSTVYRSRLEGSLVDATTAEPSDGSPWIGAATQSPTLEAFEPDHPFSFRLDAVTGYDGGSAPGDVVLWTGSGPTQGQTIFSTRKGLPEAWVFGKGKHTHFNWTFTEPGVYCMAFSVQTQMPDGSRQQARGILTQIVGSQFDPHTIEPCGRHLSYPGSPTKAVIPGTDAAPVVSGDGNADFALALDGEHRLRATYNQEPVYGDGPATAHSIDDVILYAKAGLDSPYRFRTGERGARTISWDTVQIGDSALDGDITWSIDSVRGPGDLSVTNPGEWADQTFDTANGSLSQTLWAGSGGNWRSPTWQVTRPGIYCVAMTWTATTAGGEPVSDRHVLTLVAEGPLDPDDYDHLYQSNGKSSPYAGAVWRAAEHGALEKTCAQGAQPTRADEVPVPGGGTTPVDDSAWDVPNWTTTDSGALILNNGHVDIASTLDGNALDTQIKDTTDEGQRHATHDGAAWHDPAATVLQLLPDAETTVPPGDTYAFLGQSGSPVWVVSETQQPDLIWPGWSTESIPASATRTGVSWSLDRMSGPGEFALYKGGQTLGSVDVVYNTRDGITAADSVDIPKNAHVHGSWAFSAEGTYCLGFTRSTTLTDGTRATDDFTLAVAVGRVEVTKVDPSACFATTGKPDVQDVTPVPESQLTASSQGGVQALDGGAGFQPGQLVTLRVGTSHAGQWVSTWLHSQPTWLGWAQVDPAGAVQVRLPVDAALGTHKLVVKTRDGELIGWDALVAVEAPDGGTGDGGDPGTGGGRPADPACAAGDTTILSTGHLDYSTQVVNGKIESYIGDNSSGAEVFREPSTTVLWLKPSSRVTLPAGYEQVGAAGSSVFMVPQTQDMDLIWLGWSTTTLTSSTVAGPVTWTLSDIDGPGSVTVFLDGPFGGIQSLVFDGTGSYDIRPGVHAHANWAFSKEGIYRLHFTQSATLAGGGTSSDSEVVTIVVGDVDPVSAVPGGKDCIGDDGGHHWAGDGATAGDGGQGGGAAQAAAIPAVQCTSADATVISAGHVDWNTQVIAGKLESLIGDDSTGTRRYRAPSSTVLWLRPESAVAVPPQFSQVGPPGSTIWQVPQTQNDHLIWLGWSTELLNAGNASGPVTWSLTQVEGPGSVTVYTVGSFGTLQETVFHGAGSHTIPLGVHVHANWAFSAQGVYRLHFTQTATLANGQRSSDSEVLTVAVGDVDPTTALATAAGCGTAATVVFTGPPDPQAPEQAQPGEASGGLRPPPSASGAGAAAQATVAAPPRSPVPLLLAILGALLLLGGAGVLWWRRRTGPRAATRAPADS